ncbi:hypothetical protein [Rhizohabitans arisaemae]|uniref:hypothetical protein n=1 Tax=Rhizohabitans arisaemae TaxID=2720610 RepID=UPI0024B1B1CA|nr:hypothetical protein [Rhizohabitans arisaemae]
MSATPEDWGMLRMLVERAGAGDREAYRDCLARFEVERVGYLLDVAHAETASAARAACDGRVPEAADRERILTLIRQGQTLLGRTGPDEVFALIVDEVCGVPTQATGFDLAELVVAYPVAIAALRRSGAPATTP